MSRAAVRRGGQEDEEPLRDLVVVADTHLTRRDEELSAFVQFLLTRGAQASGVAHLGDLFNVWLGRPRFQMEHMGAVLDAFRLLRDRGVRTFLAEGNRDFDARRWHQGRSFDRVSEESLDLAVAGRRVRLAHGDLVNAADRQYRAWRRFSRSRGVQGAVGLLPARAGIRLAERLEVSLRGTNTRHKSWFPFESARSSLATARAEGCELLLLGHFHEEHVIEPPDTRPGLRALGTPEWAGLVALPDWRSSHRYVYIAPDGACRLETWPAPTPPRP